KGFVRRDGVFAAGKRMMRVRPSTGRDQNVPCGDRAVLADDADGVRPLKDRSAFDQLRASVFKPAAVQPLKASNFMILVGEKRLPVEARLATRPTVCGRILKMLRKLRSVEEEFRLHAPTNAARPPHTA